MKSGDSQRRSNDTTHGGRAGGRNGTEGESGPLALALFMARAGFRVFPWDHERGIALVKHPLKDAATDEAVINQWWDAHPSAITAVSFSGPQVTVMVVSLIANEELLRPLLREARLSPVPPTIKLSRGRLRMFFTIGYRYFLEPGKQHLPSGVIAEVYGPGEPCMLPCHVTRGQSVSAGIVAFLPELPVGWVRRLGGKDVREIRV